MNPNTGEEVPYEQLVKGYELSPDRYVVIKPEELDSVEPKKTRTIDIEDFVEMDQIDPIYYERTYWLAPDGDQAKKAYQLLLAAMDERRRVALGPVVMGHNQYRQKRPQVRERRIEYRFSRGGRSGGNTPESAEFSERRTGCFRCSHSKFLLVVQCGGCVLY